MQPCGGRLLAETFSIVGSVLGDPVEARREWTIDGVYYPIWGRTLGGIRVRVLDQKGFASFLNQRDLELLLGMAEAGNYCPWLGEDYVDPYDRRWVGFCMDEDDLADDLFIREQILRVQQEDLTGSQLLPQGLEIERRLCLNSGTDVNELLALRWDMDPLTGMSPDLSLVNVDTRWTRIERERLLWHRMT